MVQRSTLTAEISPPTDTCPHSPLQNLNRPSTPLIPSPRSLSLVLSLSESHHRQQMLPISDSPSAEAQLLKKLRSFSSPTASPAAPSPAAVTAASPLLSPRCRLLLILSILALQILLLLSARSLPSRRLHLDPHLRRQPANLATNSSDFNQCPLGHVFVYDLPPAFNKDILAACDDLNPWSSSCPALSNSGFGPPATSLAAVIPRALLPSWFSTDQFAAEPIFHRRILAHRCRTLDPSAAAAFFIPFYGGLSVGRHLWSSNATVASRDRDSAALLSWLATQPPFRRHGGADHFTVLGRITWDFRRSRDTDWGGSFLYMRGMENVTRLLIERNPWDSLDVAIPYPTGFHPRTASEVRSWQRFVLDRPRTVLYSFAGATRGKFKDDFRKLLLSDCFEVGQLCQTVDCGGGKNQNQSCAVEAMGLFLNTTFCLQPRGDSFTRRSMFDCMVAGAIPVLFWRRSAYEQYKWYLPVGGGEEGEWSVFVNRTAVRSGEVSVRRVLEGIGEERVRRMRERVVEMIPRLVYAAWEEGIEGVKDAIDVAVEGVLRLFRERRREG